MNPNIMASQLTKVSSTMACVDASDIGLSPAVRPKLLTVFYNGKGRTFRYTHTEDNAFVYRYTNRRGQVFFVSVLND